MDYVGNGRLQSQVATITVDAHVIGEALGVAAETECVIRLIEIAGTQNQLGLVVSLETGAGDDVEDTVSAIAELRAITPTIDFQVINVFGIKLGTDIGRDIGIGHRHAVDQPGGLMSPADVQLVMSYVRTGHVVGNHRHAIGAVGARSALDVQATHQGRGCGTVDGDDLGRSRDSDVFIRGCDLQLKVYDRHRSRNDGYVLRSLHEALARNAHGIVAERDRVKLKFARGIGGYTLPPLRSFRFEHHHGVLNRTMLRVVYDSADGAVNTGERYYAVNQQEK